MGSSQETITLAIWELAVHATGAVACIRDRTANVPGFARTADSALISEAASSATYGYCCMSVMALLIYYYLTTLDEEFKHYSKRKSTLATFLYAANRYIPLVFAVYVPWTFSSNRKMYLNIFVQQSREYKSDLNVCNTFLFSALRTYALQRKRSWAVIVLVLLLAPVIVAAIMDRWLVIYEDPGAAPILARLPMIIADVIVILVTWKTQYNAYNMGKGLPTPMRLTAIVLRDGTIYFVILTVLNILQLLFEEIQVLTTGGLGQAQSSDLVVFVEPITAILTSEFLTHLRDAADAASGSEILSSANALEFRIIGSIGASLPSPYEDVALSEVTEENGLRGSECSEQGITDADTAASPIAETESGGGRA
ncbi:hypothetical protein ONZ51_g7812 [Trametes cubensis]|uniref:DUF6533 domain-containing protein n=1 Tax=Trametes cubensis TaxID=1111947 RepID=A0AAD7TPE8_9APHY|nr:hypothetical protein ONZ51_g7812 [Trametes cubensis]